MDMIALSSVLYLITLIASEIIFVWWQPRRPQFVLRFLLYVVGYPMLWFGLGYVATDLNGILDYEIWPSVLQIFYFAFMFFMSIPLVMFCWRISLRDAIFYCIAGYSVEHMCNAIVTIVQFVLSRCAPTVPRIVWQIALSLVFKLVLVIVVFALFVYRPLRQKRVFTSDGRIIAVSAINLIICMILNIMKGYGLGMAVNPFTGSIVCSLYALFGCTLCLWLQMGMFGENKLKEDNVALEQLLRQEAKKNELSKSTVDMINIKCHDLKYQLARLESKTDENKAEIIKGIYESFSIYDSIVKTGNEVFDLIVMNVWPACVNNSITFTYMVDGEAMSCLNPADISSLFGNLIDNALEAELNEAVDRRSIYLNVRRERQMLFIHVDNYCSVAPDFEDGLPVSTKEDKRYHGFGVRSVRYLVRKYGGDMRMTWDREMFNVDILIPVVTDP